MSISNQSNLRADMKLVTMCLQLKSISQMDNLLQCLRIQIGLNTLSKKQLSLTPTLQLEQWRHLILIMIQAAMYTESDSWMSQEAKFMLTTQVILLYTLRNSNLVKMKNLLVFTESKAKHHGSVVSASL